MWHTWWRIELDRGFIWKLERSRSGFGVDGKVIIKEILKM
jgi:hypothetical protein